MHCRRRRVVNELIRG